MKKEKKRKTNIIMTKYNKEDESEKKTIHHKQEHKHKHFQTCLEVLPADCRIPEQHEVPLVHLGVTIKMKILPKIVLGTDLRLKYSKM